MVADPDLVGLHATGASERTWLALVQVGLVDLNHVLILFVEFMASGVPRCFFAKNLAGRFMMPREAAGRLRMCFMTVFFEAAGFFFEGLAAAGFL